jgi:GT2 family glycosyltransferase
MAEFSIVTIVKGRRKQLTNLLDSVKASTTLPNDIQIVCMDNPEEIVIPDGLIVNIRLIDNTHTLPLAAARNMGISAAKTDHVIFIDVDCIVSPTLFENMLAALKTTNIITAYPLYLPIVPDTGNYNDLKDKAVTHPGRERIPAGEAVEHLQFWSLIFAVQKQTFDTIGGFDESFVGYGAEDTDFAMMFHQVGIELIFVRDFILHQYHDKHDPPVNYFHSIIENAMRYQQKWGVLPMQRWLKAFEEMGLIKIGQADQITVLQSPTDSQIKNSISAHPY